MNMAKFKAVVLTADKFEDMEVFFPKVEKNESVKKEE